MSVSERDAAGQVHAGRTAVWSGGARAGGPPPARPALARRLAGPGLFAAAGIVLFVCYLRMSSTVAGNSDGAANALQAWDMLHGNLLLHGWQLSDVSFYTTELPEYMLVQLAGGLGAGVLHVAAALTYTLLVLVAAVLAKGRATGAEACVRMLIAGGLLLAPQLGVGTQVLILSPDHVGTAVPVLATWLLLDRAPRRAWVPAAAALLLAWALAADELVLLIGIVPLLVVSLARACQQIVVSRRRAADAWYELSLAAAAVAALVVGLELPALIHALGGYTTVPVPRSFIPLSELGTRLRLTGAGLLLLFGADVFTAGHGPGTALVVLHLAGVAVAVWGISAAARRVAKGSDLVVQLLLVGTLLTVAGYLLWRQVPGIGYSHEMAPALPFAAVIAGRLLAGRLLGTRLARTRLLGARLLPVLAAVLLGYAVTLGANALHRPVPTGNQQLTAFLAAHHLSYGLSGYWQADVLTVADGNRIQVRALQVNQASVSASNWESQASWYDPQLHDARFVLLFAGRPGFAGEAGLQPFDPGRQIQATFGRPAQVYRVGRYTVLVWPHNLLRRL